MPFAGTEYVCPAHFAEDGPTWPAAEAWSVVVRFEPGTGGFGGVAATVAFLVPWAPHERLRPSRQFTLYEGARRTAEVEVVGPCEGEQGAPGA